MRRFLAIELPEPVRDALAGLRTRLRAAGGNASWPRPENLHLTLRFLGDITDEQAEDCRTALRTALAGLARPRLTVAGVGAFPNLRRPSVIWAGVQTEEEALAVIQGRCEAAARALGLDAETKPFRAHITLARVKPGPVPGALVRAIEAAAGFAGGEFTARGVALFSSVLRPQGAVYTRIEEFPLEHADAD